MRLDNLIVKGLFTFQEPAVLPAADLPRGVIAIVGAIGQGKTGLLESAIAVLQREFPTRKKDLAYYTNQRQAFIEADYAITAGEHEGHYRARLNIDGQTRKTSGTLSLRDAGGVYRALNERGLMSTYTPEVAKRFPSLEVLLATVFAAQTRRGSFASLGETDRKLLFQELLGLGRFEKWSAACVEVVRTIEKRKGTFAGWLRRLQDETTDAKRDDIERALATLRTSIENAQAQQAEASEERHAAQLAADLAGQELNAVADRTRRRAGLREALHIAESNVTELEAAIATEDANHAEQLRQHERDQQTIQRGLDRRGLEIDSDYAIQTRHDTRVQHLRALHATEVKDRRDRIKNNEDLIGRKAEVEADAKALAQLEETAAATALRLTKARTSLREVNQGVDSAQRKIQTLQHWPLKVELAKKADDYIARLPFGAKCADANCSFVTDAVANQAQRAEADAGVVALNQAKTLLGTRESVKAALETEIATIEAEAVRIADEIRLHATDKRTRDRVAQLAVAETRVQELTKDIAALDARLADDERGAGLDADAWRRTAADARQALRTEQEALQATFAASLIQHRAAHEDRSTGLLARLRAASEEVATIRAQLGTLADLEASDLGAAQRHTDALARLQTAQAREVAVGLDLRGFTVQAEGAADRLRVFVTQVEERDRVAAVVARLDAELSEWAFLASATGHDGLPTIEIDAAGPLVSERANDLLMTCYGSQRFTVEIVTQDARAKGGLKEVFEMKVWDSNDSRGARDIGDLSGGEKVLVDEAVKCALALHVNDHTRARLLTCFRDETTSAFDAETAMRYMTMLRRVQDRGQFEQVYFITHNPAVAAEADAQIVVSNGALTIKRPPFDPVAPSWVTA